MQGSIVSQGTELMIYGMGTVVFFLALLVVVTTAMSRLVSRYFPEPEVAVPSPRSAPLAQSSDDSGRRVAAITAAVKRFRSQR